MVAKNDRKLRIEVGYGLEGALTDVTSKRIIDEIITPKFRIGDFAGGISAGVDQIIRVVDGEPLPAPAPQQQRQGSGLTELIDPFNPFVIIGVLVLGAFLRTAFGRLFGSLATGGLIGVLAWFIVGSLVVAIVAGLIAFVLHDAQRRPCLAGGRAGQAAGPAADQYGGGSYSGRSSSSDSGGFSGGGGSFGGGGASGSW